MSYTYCIFHVILHFDTIAAGMLKNDLNDAANIAITLEDAIETLFAIEILMSIPIYAYIYPGTPDITHPYFNSK